MEAIRSPSSPLHMRPDSRDETIVCRACLFLKEERKIGKKNIFINFLLSQNFRFLFAKNLGGNSFKNKSFNYS